MERKAHTRLIAQLKERIAAPDNTPLYLKFAETVKRGSSVLAHSIFTGSTSDRSWPVCRALRCVSRPNWKAADVTRARGYGTQINNIFEYSLKEAHAGFSRWCSGKHAQRAVG